MGHRRWYWVVASLLYLCRVDVVIRYTLTSYFKRCHNYMDGFLVKKLWIRNMGMVAFTAFACSLVVSLKHMAIILPDWITLGQQDDLLQISHEASPEMSAQVLHHVGEYRRREDECRRGYLRRITTSPGW